MREWYKDGYFWRSKSYQWEIDQYQFANDGMGDLTINTCNLIIKQNDKSEWAFKSFVACADLIVVHKRWPDYMNNNYIAKNRLQHIWSKFMFKLGINNHVLYRHQHSITRDSYVYLYACAVHLDRKQFILNKPPWWLYNPKMWAWRRALLDKPNLYRVWHFLTPSRKDYVIALNKLRWDAYQAIKQEDPRKKKKH